MAYTVADLLVERLIAWGVDTIFGFPGDGVNGIFEALRTHQRKLQFIQVRHEEAAAFAACGYAKYTGRLGVCIATSGPGGIHLLNGLYDAKFDGAPVLAITGHTFHDLIGTHNQQDVDLDKLYMDVTVYNQRVMGPAHVVNVVDEAVKCAMSRHGVSHITIPKDMQEWSTKEQERSKWNIPRHSVDRFAMVHGVPNPDELQAAADVLNQGSRVAILAGRGALGAGREVLEIAEKLSAPVIKPLLGKAAIPDGSPYALGGVGLLGTAPSHDALQNCDTLLIIGSSLPYIQFYPKPGEARAVQIDADPVRIGLRYPVEIGLAGDTRETLKALLPLLKRNHHGHFLKQAQKNMQKWNDLLRERGTRADKPMKPQVVAWELNKLLREDAIISSDSGTIATWAARYLQIRGDMRFSLSGTLATMANGLPYSIGAAVAHPGRQVIAFVGDGGLTMLMGELATLVKYRLPVKVIVIKNGSLGQIKWEQMVLGGNPAFGIDLQAIDFAGYAVNCGMAGFTVEDPGDAGPVLREALAHHGPALVECVVDANEPPMPGNITLDQALHFAEALAKDDKNRWKIMETVTKDKILETV